MGRQVRFGVTIPQIKRSWEDAREAAELFDRLGYRTGWVCDHLFGVPMPSLPILEAYTEMAALAAVTRNLELGALVTPPYFRSPAVLAKQIATIDAISAGRAIAGLGAGWFAAEFEGYGCPFPSVGRRLRALEETCEILRLVWEEDGVDYRGREFQLSGNFCQPKPVRRIPILIGGGGEKVLLRIAARHADIWNNLAVQHTDLARKIEVLRSHCDAERRDFDEIEISQQCLVVIDEDADRALESVRKAERVYGGHMGADLEARGLWGTPTMLVDKIAAMVELGCTHLLIEFFGRDSKAPATLFAEQVMPAFG